MNRLSPGLLAVFVLVALGHPCRAADDPKGTYSVTVGDARLTLTFDGAGKYTFKRNSEVQVEGAYKVAKDQIEFVDKRGPIAIPEKIVGKYKWALNAKKLSFTRVEDRGEGRAQALTMFVWLAEP
jgi:hypothetical protein